MLLKQTFRTGEGARKRAAFENAHCNGRFRFTPVRCIGPASQPDTQPFDAAKFKQYTWRLERTTICK